MAKEQRDDDWQDHSVMAEIKFSAKGVAPVSYTHLTLPTSV